MKTCWKVGEFSTFVENLSKVFNKNLMEMLKTQASKTDYGGLWFLGGVGVCSPIVNPITLDNFNSIKITQNSRKFIFIIVKWLPEYYFRFQQGDSRKTIFVFNDRSLRELISFLTGISFLTARVPTAIFIFSHWPHTSTFRCLLDALDCSSTSLYHVIHTSSRTEQGAKSSVREFE